MKSNPRKIAFVTDARGVWGAERSLLGLVGGAVANGWGATIVCPESSPLVAFCREQNMAVDFRFEDLPEHPGFALGGLKAAGARGVLAEVSATIRAARWIRGLAQDYDVVVSFEMWRNLEVALGCMGLKSHAVLDMHDVFDGRLGLKLNKLAGTLASFSLGPSLYTLRKTGLAGSRSAVVPRGTFVPDTPLPPRSGGVLTFTTLGEARAYKRVDLFCEVLLECARRGLPVQGLIVGDVPEDESGLKIKELIASSDGVLRHVPTSSDVVPYLQQSDYVVNAAQGEAFGRTMIEGLANGAVPVSFSRSGPAEIILTAGIGHVLDDTDGVDGLVEGLTSAVQDKEMRTRAHEDGKSVVQREFSWEAVAGAYYQKIEQAVL